MPNDPRKALERLCAERGEDFAGLSRFLGKNPAYIQQYIRRGTPRRLGEDERSLDRWFDTGAFVRNDPFTFGNAARNLIEGPGVVNFDFAVYKYFRISEGKRLQFRCEAFNLFNTPQFDVPNAQIGNPNVGRISSAGRPRNLQFGIKFLF